MNGAMDEISGTGHNLPCPNRRAKGGPNDTPLFQCVIVPGRVAGDASTPPLAMLPLAGAFSLRRRYGLRARGSSLSFRRRKERAVQAGARRQLAKNFELGELADSNPETPRVQDLPIRNPWATGMHDRRRMAAKISVKPGPSAFAGWFRASCRGRQSGRRRAQSHRGRARRNRDKSRPRPRLG